MKTRFSGMAELCLNQETPRRGQIDSSFSHRETDDRYYGEICRYGRYRIIVCKDGIQWVAQRKKAGAGARWRALGYFLTKKALIRLWTALDCPHCPELEQLPPNFRRAGHE